MLTLAIIQIALFAIGIATALIYIIILLSVRRFHHRNNIFTVNLAAASLLCTSYWLIHYFLWEKFPQFFVGTNNLTVITTIGTLCTIEVPLAMIAVSFYRLLTIVYYRNNFFRRDLCVMMTIASQWLLGFLLSLPLLYREQQNQFFHRWRFIYGTIFIVFVPGLIIFINNMIIFHHVRSSSKRIRPSVVSNNQSEHRTVPRRDIHLLRHIMFMFCVFIGGWCPTSIYPIFADKLDYNATMQSVTMLIAEISLLTVILDLYQCNHELKRFVCIHLCPFQRNTVHRSSLH